MAQWQSLHLETRKCEKVVGLNPTESSCWALVPQVCSYLPGNPGAVYGSLAPKARYFLVHKHGYRLMILTSIFNIPPGTIAWITHREEKVDFSIRGKNLTIDCLFYCMVRMVTEGRTAYRNVIAIHCLYIHLGPRVSYDCNRGHCQVSPTCQPVRLEILDTQSMKFEKSYLGTPTPTATTKILPSSSSAT